MNTKLKSWLHSNGVTQTAFARANGWRVATVNDWLSGRRRPSMKSAARIEQATNGAVRMTDWLDASEAAA